MSWLCDLQNMIDYVEEHLLEELDAKIISDKMNYSINHFQRMFMVLTDMTVVEYIRNRRLSEAGKELLTTDKKIINIAMKYGYDSHESFTRAFVKFHGVTPKVARQKGAQLKSFSVMQVTVVLTGGDYLNYRIVDKPAFRVVGIKEKFILDDELSKVDINNYWKKCYEDGTIYKKLIPIGHDNVVVGVSDAEYANDYYTYFLGVVSDSDKIPESCEVMNIPEMTWAIFQIKGYMPAAIQTMWKRVYSEFFPKSDYEPIPIYDFECFPEGNKGSEEYQAEIWIPIRKK